nr:hypothetical protein [Tanacetum cinerariifolium]
MNVIITENNIRSDLCLDDAEGTACLLDEEIFEGLARMGYEKPSQKLTFYKAYFSSQWKFMIHTLLQCLSAKTTDWNEFSSTMASAIIYMCDTPIESYQTPIVDQPCTSQPQKPQMLRRKQRKEAETSHYESANEDHVPTPSSDPLPSGEDSFILNELMVFCTSLQEQVLNLQEAKAAQAKEIAALKKKVSKINKWRKSRFGGLRRLKRFGSVRRVKSLMEKDGLGAHEDAFKHERMIKEIDQNSEIALDDETQQRTNDDEMFGVDDLAGEEVVVETTTSVKDSVAPIIDVTEDALKSVKLKVMVQEQDMSTTIPAAATKVTIVIPTPRATCIVFHEQKQSQIPIVSSSKDKGKAKMIKPEVPLKKKEQMRINKEYARKLQAEEQEASRLSRAQQDEEASNSLDNIQAMMDADRLLAKRLQAREREEFFEVQKARLLVELIEKRKKHFAALRAQDKRSKLPTKTQMKSQMFTYLRHLGGYKQSHLKGKSIDEIKELFDREIRKQKVDKNVEPVVDDSTELRKCIEIVPDDGDEVLIEATPISSRSPTIIAYTRKERRPTSSLLEQMGFVVVLAVLKPERLKADRARRLLISVLLFTVCKEAIKVESCPSEIILDDLLALDSIVRFDLGDRRLEQTATFLISTNSERERVDRNA